jgi:uncharacterized protein
LQAADSSLKVELDGGIADVMELCLYNSVLTAMSHDGTKFTYVNQLASSDEHPAIRSEWFTCACCPPNIMRLLGQIGGYVYSRDNCSDASVSAINVHLFISSVGRFEVDGHSVVIEQQSKWPWSGDIRFHVQNAPKPVGVNIRIPAWAEEWTVRLLTEHPSGY